MPGPDNNMDPVSDAVFGTRLRKERERRRITLTSIAANTKINIALLHGLEAGDVSRWPSGIFRRSFIRGYANAIGLDADEIAKEFLERFPDPNEPVPAPAPPPATNPLTTTDPHHLSTTLRLRLVESTPTFMRGPILSSAWRRWAAAAWDVAAVFAMGVLLFLGLGQFWMSVAVATLAYYASSIVVLGNTPGVSFFAAARRPTAAEPQADRPARSLMRLFTRSAGF
jgi:transcriptional regulator with XRE-family HTH domain